MTTATSHHIKDGQHSPVLPNYDLTCFKTCDTEEDNCFIVMPYLDIETRARIVGMQKAGLPLRAISDLVGIPLSTVYDTVAKFQVIGTVTDLMTHHVSTHTIQRKIHKLGKCLRIAPKKPYLRPQDFQRCLAFAQAHCHWTINN
ncbi:hypothetical protein O181_130102 [Austropuccinia psidii MF-1]|uniref:Transposase Tc1-like domain-containing protein n=1 Tax=Austropuccinia psidii MF-1 TaxID=1389203 RepID=A0A9Q3L343_9BASI|nr:hypothetical protein [Austropuccinia psidii MF-1]